MIHYLSLCRHPDTLLRPLHNWTSFNSPSRHSLHSHSESANDFASHATLSCHCTEDNIYSGCGLHQAKNLLPLRRRLLGQGNEIVTLGFNLLLHEGEDTFLAQHFLLLRFRSLAHSWSSLRNATSRHDVWELCRDD